MPCTLARLPCGVIYTEAFSDYLATVHEEQVEDNPRKIITLEYVRYGSGELKGRAWWQLQWVPVDSAPDYRCFRMGPIFVHIPKSVQQGLKERCLDFREGRVVVFP